MQQKKKPKYVFQILPLMCRLQRNYDVIQNWERFETGQLSVHVTAQRHIKPSEKIALTLV